jgi:CheY-like chemotaxis protein
MRVRTKCVIISLLTTAEESGRPTILVVDDQEIIADTTAEILSRFGFRAVRTYDAQRRCRLPQSSSRTLAH